MRLRKLTLYRLLPISIFLILWESLLHNNKELVFYYGLPSKIFEYLISKTLDGSLIKDFLITLSETIIGFIIGNIIGSVIGLTLWFSKLAFNVSKPYIIALGSAPIFALAPLMIIWFGTGMLSKIMIATLSTMFIALLQSYSGALDINPNYYKLLKTYNASKGQVFRKIVVPSSVTWVISAFKINVGFALLGAFIGEYISSSAGLGHLILVASGLFDISLILLGVIMMVVIALILNYIVSNIEKPLKKFIIKHL